MTKNKQNTIPKGYKQTKLGIIPEEWELDRIDNIFEFINTNSLSRSKLNYNIAENSIYNIHYGDIHATFTKPILDLDEENKIPIINTDVDISKYSFLKEGDLIIADASEDYDGVGKAIELKNVKQKKLVAGLHTFALRDNTNKTGLGFRAYAFKNQKVSNKLKTIATGSKVYGISKSNIAKFEIILPTLPEQKAIAKILSTWDKAINNYQLLIVNYQLKKKGLMQKLLKPKKDWKEVRLGEVFTLGSGKTKPNETVDNKTDDCQIPVYGGNGVSGFSKTIFQNGERILIGRVGEYCGCVHYVKDNYWITDNCLYIKDFLIDANIKFYYFFLEYLKLDRLKNKGGQPLVSQKPILNLKVKVPDKETQTQIANILSSADKEIDILEQQLEKLKEQKKGLMQVLLSGQKRVKVMDN